MAQPEILDAKEDTYHGVIIEASSLPTEIPAFAMRLTHSLAHWQRNNKRGIWLKIPIGLSHLIVIAADVWPAAGRLPFSSCRVGLRDDDKVAPYIRAQLTTPLCKLLCCGGFVLNDKNEILVVMEKSGPAARLWWKMPGGAADPGEELHDAAKREVLEETGIKTEVVSLLCFRTQHEYQFGKSDMYFLFRLKPLTTEIHKCEKEIADAKWMPLEEFCNLPYYKGLWKAFQSVMKAEGAGQYAPWSFTSLPAVVRRGENYIYHSPSAKF